jgi:hypothetical protein
MTEWSKNVLAVRSKNVSARERVSPANDAKHIAKIRSFRVGDDPHASTSSVSTPTPSISYPSGSMLTPLDSKKACAPPTPANDNLIPVWSLTGVNMTAVAATAALLIEEKPAVAFTFNLTPDAIAKAMASSTGFLDSLKRSFDVELKRALLGVVLPYWFAVDIEKGRLHIHGAFLSPAVNLPMVRRIRKAMKAAWGEWEGPGKHKQLRFQTLYSDDWATYCMRNQRAVAKIIGPRTFTINQALRRDAEWAYAEIRRIMRAA